MYSFTYIWTTPELESNALDRSAMTLQAQMVEHQNLSKY